MVQMHRKDFLDLDRQGASASESTGCSQADGSTTSAGHLVVSELAGPAIDAAAAEVMAAEVAAGAVALGWGRDGWEDRAAHIADAFAATAVVIAGVGEVVADCSKD